MVNAPAPVADPIGGISVLSTGTVAIRPEHVEATGKPMYWWLLTSRRWTSHDVADVHTAVMSHLHQDHIGGLRELTGAELLVSRREWETLGKAAPELRGLLRSHIDIPGLRWRHVDLEPPRAPGGGVERRPDGIRAGHDLFGDGALVLLSTPGHTPGSMSLLVRRPNRPPLLMVGDLTYDAHLLQAGRVPGVGSRRQLRATTAWVNELRQRHPDLVILPAHDPGAAARLAAATGTSSPEGGTLPHASG